MPPCFVVGEVGAEQVVGAEGELEVAQHEGVVGEFAHQGFGRVRAVETLERVVVGA